jgi:hypothetical protein
VSLIIANLLVGMSYGWWQSKHNRHHANPNKEGADPDIALTAIAFTPERATRHHSRLKRSSKTEQGRHYYLSQYSEGALVPEHVLDVFEAEVELVSAWIQGAGLPRLAAIGPRFSHANALFGGDDDGKRTSDAAQYMGGLAYYAGWVWSGVKILWDARGGLPVPGFIRDAVEFGAPSEAATRLISLGGLTRPGAVQVVDKVGDASSTWDDCQDWLNSDRAADLTGIGLTRLDLERLVRLQDRFRI